MSYRSSTVLLLALLLTGCTGPRAPAFLLLGSYFPAWLIGTAVGIPATLIVRWVLIRSGLDDGMPCRLLVYVCMTISFAMVFAYVFSPR